MIEIIRFVDADGRCPFEAWFAKLRDGKARIAIIARLVRLENGNFGDAKPVGEGVIELRIQVGAGYRIYFGRHADRLVILLSGGDKSTQSSDIERAKQFWKEWKRDQL